MSEARNRNSRAPDTGGPSLLFVAARRPLEIKGGEPSLPRQLRRRRELADANGLFVANLIAAPREQARRLKLVNPDCEGLAIGICKVPVLTGTKLSFVGSMPPNSDDCARACVVRARPNNNAAAMILRMKSPPPSSVGNQE